VQGNRVWIAATRDEAGHADGFWALALMERARRFGVSGMISIEGIFIGNNKGGGKFIPRQFNITEVTARTAAELSWWVGTQVPLSMSRA
jgi:hypothetical protein